MYMENLGCHQSYMPYVHGELQHCHYSLASQHVFSDRVQRSCPMYSDTCSRRLETRCRVSETQADICASPVQSDEEYRDRAHVSTITCSN